MTLRRRSRTEQHFGRITIHCDKLLCDERGKTDSGYHHARYMELLTAVFAVGQILGPPVVGMILARAESVNAGFDLALGLAGLALVLGAATFVLMSVLYPAKTAKGRREK